MDASDTITDRRGRVACPVSIDRANLLTNFKVHFTTARQIQKYGMCRACRARFKRDHGAILIGEKTETPAAMTNHRELPNLENDHAGHEAPGEVIQTTDFDFGAVDEALGIFEDAPPDARQQAAEVLQNIWRWLYAKGGQTPLRTAAAKLGVLVSGFSPDTLDGATLETMADELGVTKSAMSKINVTTQKRFSLMFPRSRSDESKAHMAAAAMGHRPTFKGRRNGNTGNTGGGAL